MDYTKKVKFLKRWLYIIGVFIVLFEISWVIWAFERIGNKGIINTLFSIIFSIVFFVSYSNIIISLIRILDLILQKNPFVSESITCFRRVGYYILAIGIVDAIIRYPIPNNTGFEILAFGNGSLKPIFFLYMVLSLLAFILGDVFKMAIDIKDENDLTI